MRENSNTISTIPAYLEIKIILVIPEKFIEVKIDSQKVWLKAPLTPKTNGRQNIFFNYIDTTVYMYCRCAHNWNTFSQPASHLEVRLGVKYLHMGAVADVRDLSI